MVEMGIGGDARGDKRTNKNAYGTCKIIGCERGIRSRFSTTCKHHYDNPPQYPEQAEKFIRDGAYYAYIAKHPLRTKESQKDIPWGKWLYYDKNGLPSECDYCGADLKRWYTREVDNKLMALCQACNQGKAREDNRRAREIKKINNEGRRDEAVLKQMRLWSKANVRSLEQNRP